MSSTRPPPARSLAYDYLSAVLHDLRNPLGATTGNLLYIREGFTLPDGQPPDLLEALDDATDAIRRVETLIEELSSVAQHNTGTLRVQLEPFDLTSLLQQCVQDAQREALLRSIEITVAVSSPVLVMADRSLARRATTSLIWNAFRNLPSLGKMELSTRSEGGRGAAATLILCHSAPSPSTEDASGAFEREPGLFFAKCMLEAHGGKIRVERSQAWPTTILATFPADPAVTAVTLIAAV